MARASSRKRSDVAARGKVKPHDPFELIRWLAYSQPDPRKALAELVQNSLDAGAARVVITRVRERGIPCLRVRDDGEGVIPSLERVEALRYIATNIGHSRKRSLSPKERLELMTQGQYGIGLLGFWSLGERLEIRSSVPDQVPHKLVLRRDDPRFEIEPIRSRLVLDERFTEVVVVGVHTTAQAALAGRRAADYLSAELRGQLLARQVEILYEDRMSRGSAPKSIPIRPVRFAGERLAGFDLLVVEGHAPIRLEIYVTTPTEVGGGALSIYAAGTLVAESFAGLGGLGLDRTPWIDPRLSGFVDFPELTVTPGSRRGIVADSKAEEFAKALLSIEPKLTRSLELLDAMRAQELDRILLRDLRRAFRDLLRAKPRYQLPRAPAEGRVPSPASDESGSEHFGREPSSGVERPEPSKPQADSQLTLLPPGPLHSVRVVPAQLRLAIHSERSLRAEPLDVTGRRCEGSVQFRWSVDGLAGSVVELDADPCLAILRAGDQLGSGAVHVVATQDERRVENSSQIEIVESLDRGGSLEGIPEPHLIDDSAGSWRSRWIEDRWEVNAGHADYTAVAEKPTLKLRYLALLFAKEVVVKSSGDPRFDRPLEQLIEVFAFADRALARQVRRGSAATKSGDG